MKKQDIKWVIVDLDTTKCLFFTNIHAARSYMKWEFNMFKDLKLISYQEYLEKKELIQSHKYQFGGSL